MTESQEEKLDKDNLEKYPETYILEYKTKDEIFLPLKKSTGSSLSDPGSDFEIYSTNKGIFHQLLITGAVLILSAACGMPIGYSAVLLPQLYDASDPLSMDIELGSWFASIHSLAVPIGSFLSGPLADKFGRRPTLLAAVVPLIIGWAAIAAATSHTWLIIGRITCGIAVGLVGAPAQILIAEIAQPRLRGLLIGAPFVSYSLGILFVYGLGTELPWRIAAWCGIILPTISAAVIFLLPESPAWLAHNGSLDKAAKALIWIRGNETSARRELNMLVRRNENESGNSEDQRKSESLWKILTAPTVLKPLVIINGFNFLQIFSGTFIVVFYAVDLFSEYGGEVDAMTAAVMTAVVRLICTVIFCILILFMHRRTLFVAVGLGSAASAIIFGIYSYARVGQPKSSMDLYVAAFCMISYIASNTGFMVIPGILVGELLPAKIRGRIAGYVFAFYSIITFVIAKIFPFIQQTLKIHGLFIIFGIASGIASLFLFLLLPETKGSILHQIEDYFSGAHWLWFRRKRAKNDHSEHSSNSKAVA